MTALVGDWLKVIGQALLSFSQDLHESLPICEGELGVLFGASSSRQYLPHTFVNSVSSFIRQAIGGL
jgi:hypothetical protein